MFYDNYERLCKSLGKTPSGIAKELNISAGTVSAWRKGSTPTGQMLQKIADYFDVSTDYLMTGKEPTYTAIKSADDEIEIFEAIDALKRENVRRLVLRLASSSDDDIKKVNGFLDLTQIGDSHYGS